MASDDGAVMLVGAGPSHNLDPGAIRRSLARVAPSLTGYATVGVPLPSAAGTVGDVVIAAAEGILLGSHRFERFRTRSAERGAGRFLLGVPPDIDAGAAEQALGFGIASAEAGIEVRDLANTPANHCTPEDLANSAESLESLPGLEVEVWREEELSRERCGGIFGIGQGTIGRRATGRTWRTRAVLP